MSPERPLGRFERWTLLLFVAVVLGLLAGEVATDYRPAKLGGLFVLLFWIPLLAVHEAGHAVAAVMCGWSVRRVVIGYGRLVAVWRVRGVPVELRAFPVEGFVSIAPRRLRRPRLESALIYFAGPGTELVLGAAVLAIVGPATLLAGSTDPLVIAAQSLCAAVLVGSFSNLVPHPSRRDDTGGFTPNDGLGILRSFLLPVEHWEAMLDPD